MRLCVPTETDEGKKAKIYENFATAPYYTIYDTDTGAIEIVDNDDQDDFDGEPFEALAERDFEAVVCGGMGAKAVYMLNQAGIKVYRSIDGTLEDVAARYLAGKLEEIRGENF